MNNFSKRFTTLTENFLKGVDKVVKTAAIVADRELVISTPVDTGRARSNWIVSIGPSSNQIREIISLESNLAQSKSTIESRTFGQDIAITNNLTYISRLNEGYSAQAPAGFVQDAVMIAVKEARKVKVLDGN